MVRNYRKCENKDKEGVESATETLVSAFGDNDMVNKLNADEFAGFS